MKKYFILIMITSCSTSRPGPMVVNEKNLDDRLVSKDIIECEKIAVKSTSNISLMRKSQSKCLERKGYKVVGWN